MSTTTDALRGDAVRGLGRVVRTIGLLAAGGARVVAALLAVLAGVVVLGALLYGLAAGVGWLTRPLAHYAWFTHDGVPLPADERGAFALYLSFVGGAGVWLLYLILRDTGRAIRRAWLRAEQAEPEYGEWASDGWRCPRCPGEMLPWEEVCDGRPHRRPHPPVLRPEDDR